MRLGFSLKNERNEGGRMKTRTQRPLRRGYEGKGQKRKYGAENRCCHRDFKAAYAADDDDDDEGGNRAETRGFESKDWQAVWPNERDRGQVRGEEATGRRGVAGNSVNYLYQSLEIHSSKSVSYPPPSLLFSPPPPPLLSPAR